MSGEAIWVQGAVLNIALTGSTSTLANGAFAECDDDDRQPADSAGYGFAHFELDTGGTHFGGAPTAGAAVNIYEQKMNSNGDLAPAPSATNKAGFIGSLSVDPVNNQKYLTSEPLPINLSGGHYWIEWADGGIGAETLIAGWLVRMFPVTINSAA